MRFVFAVVCMLCVVGSWTAVAQAASLYLDPAFPTIYRGDSVTIAVRVDTDELAGECVNAVDAVLAYDASIQPVDVSVGDSIFNVWVESPKIDPVNRTITFAGGIPNGYCGRIEGDPKLSNVIAKIVFRSPGLQIGGGDDANKAMISFRDETAVYLNDGFGTLAPLTTFPSTITLERNPGAEIVDTWRKDVQSDKAAPQQFGIELSREDKAFGGDYFIVFNTTDKETGLSHYEVMEEPASDLTGFRWGRADAPWVTARSPYVLKDQSLNSVIRVKAVDKAGNEYVATYIPEESMRSLSQERLLLYVLIVALGALVFILLAIVIFWFRRRRRDQAAQEPVLPEAAALSRDSTQVGNE